MNYQTIIKLIQCDQFTKVTNEGKCFEDATSIYAKEIGQNIFLVFITLQNDTTENIRAMIAHFEDLNSIGLREPKQIMFYLSIKDKNDLHYFDKYLKVPEL
ncbi:hypothetical protein CEY12_03170 [Chryseobacterium sp. T16E-39]|uniref:hypothetical protein n=1 Tax=Chryseobacterium sp. T16E-39 TaxID=2015076 RepID=UPI000B5B2B52|nr:hypothetical protein [Chryseobacterium sp. T16E-39]ASK29167.1 hypothetical protein CEY12_03170 [Chryseobacterium sp. T16E-39]